MTEMAKTLPVKNEAKTPTPVEQPWSSLDNLRQEIDRLFDDFHPLSWRLPFGRALRAGPAPSTSEWQMAPAVDVSEKPNEFEITAELPGMDEKNVEIKLSNGTLTIKGEKREEKEERQKDYYLSERRYGTFQRSFRLPDTVDSDRIEASFAKGLLTVKLPKSVEAQKAEKKIDIKAT